MGRRLGTVILVHGTHDSVKMLAAEVFADYAQKLLFSTDYGEIDDSAKEAKTTLAKILHLA